MISLRHRRHRGWREIQFPAGPVSPGSPECHPWAPGRRTRWYPNRGGPMPVLANIIGPELLIVLAVVALLFGGSRLPHLARSLGSAKGEFERGLRDDPSK